MIAIDPSRPVLVAGATASGKSDLALALAARHGGVVINADALQVYGCWRVLTARPGAADEARARHALYGHVGRRAPYSVGTWLGDVARVMAEHTGRLPIFVGGTGLYFTALTNGLADIPEVSHEVREDAERRLASGGIEALLGDLCRRDPDTAGRIDRRNPARVRRAWEVLAATGRGLHDWQRTTPPPLLPLENCTALVIDRPKDELLPRISRRFDSMLAGGALDECRAALADWDPALPSSQAIGARELVAHLRGEIPLSEARQRVLVATRRYAKRQRSWFRARMGNWRKIRPGAAGGALEL